MNRTDRLLAIVLELQARKLQRAEDLAATFEVTKRTIYRDVQALCEAGVPVVSLPRQGYSLVEGYFLPPLSFSTDEAMMLLLGSDFAAQNFDANYRAAAQSAKRKIEAVLPDVMQAEVDYLQRSIRFVVCNMTDPLDMLQQLRRAILERKRIRFDYHARVSADRMLESQRREVDPYAVIHISGKWQLIGFCHLRQAIRHFRLDRIEDLALLECVFNRPADYQPTGPREEERTLIIRVLFDRSAIRWVRESMPVYRVSDEDYPDGLLVTFSVRHEDELFQWLFSWGSHIKLLEPDTLRQRLAKEAATTAANMNALVTQG